MTRSGMAAGFALVTLAACGPEIPEGAGLAALEAEQARRAALRGHMAAPHVEVRHSAQTIGTAPVITRPAPDPDDEAEDG